MADEFRRWPALLVSALVIAAAIWPALRDPPRDSFPLSNYPMFSSVRGKPWVHIVVGFDAEGREHRIGPRLIASAEVMQASETVRKAIRRKQARRLCEQVAARVADEPELASVVRLELQSRRFDPLTYFVDEAGKTPLRTRRRASCEVPR